MELSSVAQTANLAEASARKRVPFSGQASSRRLIASAEPGAGRDRPQLRLQGQAHLAPLAVFGAQKYLHRKLCMVILAS